MATNAEYQAAFRKRKQIAVEQAENALPTGANDLVKAISVFVYALVDKRVNDLLNQLNVAKDDDKF